MTARSLSFVAFRRRHAVRRLRAAELELAEAKYRVDVWGFGDGPQRRAEKLARIARAERRVEKWRSRAATSQAVPQ